MKNYLKLGILLFGISLAITGCQKDDDLIVTTSEKLESNILKIKSISFEELKQNTLVYNKITDSKSKFNVTNSASKIVVDNTNNFSINTDAGIYIENGHHHSYTFEVERVNDVNYLLENLVLNKIENGYETILYQYDVTQEEFDLISERKYVDLEGKIIKTLLENSNISDEVLGKYFFNGNCYIDTQVYVAGQSCPTGHDWSYVYAASQGNETQCIYLGNINGPTPGNWVTQSTITPCDGQGGDGSTNPPDEGDGHGGNNNNGSVDSTPNTPCRTCPVLDECPIDMIKNENDVCVPDPHIDNCEELQKLLEIPTYPISSPSVSPRNAIMDLQGKWTQADENGYSFRHNSSLQAYAVEAPVVSSSEISFPSFPNIYGCAHTHPNNGVVIPMFSPGDIKSLLDFANIYNNGSTIDPSLPVVIMVTIQGTYAIKIKSLTNLQELTNINNNIKQKKRFDRKLKRMLGRFYNKTTQTLTGSANQYQKAFLNFINDYDGNGSSLGLSLYKTDPTISSWEEITLDSSEIDGTKEKPCN